ncbi:hypothetical protein ACFYNY_24285 [Streptomyces sp. NPDC006530]|uniref:hypothetical protein n=1 Tax=Streptomyces sp. NPDC006530 TaxID=3364750 RepID=UPI003698FACE
MSPDRAAAPGDINRARTTVAAIDTSALSSRRISDRLATVHRTLNPQEMHP